jgi:hypothetical protein
MIIAVAAGLAGEIAAMLFVVATIGVFLIMLLAALLAAYDAWRDNQRLSKVLPEIAGIKITNCSGSFGVAVNYGRATESPNDEESGFDPDLYEVERNSEAEWEDRETEERDSGGCNDR